MSSIHDTVKAALKPFAFLHGALSFFILIALGASLAVGAYFLREVNKTSTQNANELKLLNQYYVIQNQQTILLKIVDSKLRNDKGAAFGSATMEEKIQTSKMMYDMATIKKVPLHLLCGIAETESQWNTHAVSSAGCVGLLQITPAYARVYLREKGINYSKDIFFDPVINAMCGISMLADYQFDCLEKGIATPDNWHFATHHYFWGPSKRDNKFDMNYSMKVIEASKKYKEMGL